MKKSILFMLLSAIAAISLTGCQDSYENVSDHNNIWNTSVNPVTTIFLDGVTDAVTHELSVTMAQPVNYVVNATYGTAPDKLADYNAIYGASAEILPEECYSFLNNEVIIESGAVTSSAAQISFSNLKSLDDTHTYVLPVVISNANVDVLKSRATGYYVIRGASLINVVGNMSGTYLGFVNPGQAPMLEGLRKMTFECLIYPEAFTNSSNISTLMGVEGDFLFRIGDSDIPANALQLATDNDNFTHYENSAWVFDTKKWTFLTVTVDLDAQQLIVYFNGVQKGGVEKIHYPGPINWNVENCFIGYSYEQGRDFNGNMSEVRVWNKILTPEEIAAPNHFYIVDPESEGLVGYWKFNEGAGNKVFDKANGYDMAVPATWPGADSGPGSIQWVEVSLPEE